MLDNLSARGCGLPGAFPACRDKTSQVERLTVAAGWDGAACWSMNEVYSDLLPPDQVQRVEKIEFLDERELVHQLFDHYCITLGWVNASKGVSFDNVMDNYT